MARMKAGDTYVSPSPPSAEVLAARAAAARERDGPRDDHGSYDTNEEPDFDLDADPSRSGSESYDSDCVEEEKTPRRPRAERGEERTRRQVREGGALCHRSDHSPA